MPKDIDSRVYEFSGFRLEVAQRRLLYRGESITLKPKILDLLLYLVETRGQLIGKDDLMREVWPDTVVEENNITVSISHLRKILGEDRFNPKFIETVPRSGYRFVAEVTELSVGQSPAPVARQVTLQADDEEEEEPIDSLAVLPMKSPDRDFNLEYLSDGITESIVNVLSRIPKLRVLACSTVFRFKAVEIDPQEVGQKLNVKAVMMIRVIRVEERLIIRSELVKVSDGTQLWGEQYNRTPSDILAIQDEIAKAITESLKFKLTRNEEIRLTKQPTENIEAYKLYLRGRYLWNKYDKDFVLKAIDVFREAIAIDSHYALAYCGLADAYFRLSNIHFPPREVLPKAKEAALRAVEIDDQLAEAHSSLGLVNVYYDLDWSGAETAYRKALKLNPQLVSAHQRYGSYLTFMGRFEESIRRYEAALQLDPFSLQINMNLATTYFLRGEYDRAARHLLKTGELEPNYMPIHFVLGCSYIQQGRLDDAIAEFKCILELDNEAYLALGYMGHAYALNNQRAEAEVLRNTLEETAKQKYVSPYGILVIELALGNHERVFELLEHLCDERNEWVVWLKVSPELRSLRSEPRFKGLLNRIGFPD
ncbi:MAG TPA: winged helix-turn-helix domain-containing protein [Pyrinomonadaceae bacterium]|nr:winged helix-turn-helix domain-containing protein [Pyrinomonadaceae bacterium]